MWAGDGLTVIFSLVSILNITFSNCRFTGLLVIVNYNHNSKNVGRCAKCK